jgi:peptidoglycan/LPS O-acetylase OafA/YrhL
VAIVAAFYALIYRPQWLFVCCWPPVSTLGAASYSLYLLHQFIGLTLLRSLTAAVGAPGEVVAAAVMLGLAGASIFIYRYWETPAKRVMLRLLLPAPAPGHRVRASASSLPAN